MTNQMKTRDITIRYSEKKMCKVLKKKSLTAITSIQFISALSTGTFEMFSRITIADRFISTITTMLYTYRNVLNEEKMYRLKCLFNIQAEKCSYHHKCDSLGYIVDYCT